MQIHELTQRHPTNEGLGAMMKGVADVAGRSVMQKYGGSTGGTTNLGATASTAQGMATKLSDPLVKQMSTSMKATFKQDVQNLIKSARGPDNTPVTSASQLNAQDIKQALLGEVTKMIGFDYKKVVDIVDPAAGNNTGAEMAKTVQDNITAAVDAIASTETSGTPAAIKQQEQYWLMLAQNVQSAKSMAEFNKAKGTDVSVQSPADQALKQKADTAGLTPEKLGVNGNLSDPRTQKALAAMGMALEMGWAGLEPFIFSVADISEDQQESVREIVREMRNTLIKDFIS
jgi:hypothetical protein